MTAAASVPFISASVVSAASTSVVHVSSGAHRVVIVSILQACIGYAEVTETAPCKNEEPTSDQVIGLSAQSSSARLEDRR